MFSAGLAADTLTTGYVWEVSMDMGTTWDTLTDGGAYSGSMTDTLMVYATGSDNGYQYRMIAFNDSGVSAPSSAATLTVLPLANAGTISGTPVVCHGATDLLTSTMTGGTWSSVSPSVATVDATTGLVTTVAPGTDTIKYTMTNSCGSATAWYLVSVDPTLTSTSVSGPFAVCTGSMIHFTSTLAGGVWSLANAHASIDPATGYVTGATAGVDTAMYMVSNACNSVSGSAVFTVEAPLTAATLSGSTSVCAGSLVSLTASAPGGFWLSSNAAIASVDGSGNVTGHALGMATISYIFSNSCGDAVATDTVMVEHTASMITGIDSVGVGMTTSLMDSVMGGMWSTGDTAYATVDASTGVVTGVATGAASITYTVTNGCGTSWAAVTVYVGTAPSAGAISGPDSVCMGSSALYTATIGGGMWSMSNANAFVNDSGLVTGLIGGAVDTLMYTYTNAFGSGVAIKVFRVGQPPVISITGPATIVLGNDYPLTATPAGGTWAAAEAGVTFISYGTFVATTGGTHNLVYYDTNACGSSTDTFSFTLPGGSNYVHNVNANGSNLSIYPNPSNGSFTLEIASADNDNAVVTVTNVAGQVVKVISVPANKTNSISLDVESGIYFIEAKTSLGTYSGKITIAK